MRAAPGPGWGSLIADHFSLPRAKRTFAARESPQAKKRRCWSPKVESLCTEAVTMRHCPSGAHSASPMGLCLSRANRGHQGLCLRYQEDYRLPLCELWVLQPVWEALPTNPEAFQDSVASQLVHDQVGVLRACQEGGTGQRVTTLGYLRPFLVPQGRRPAYPCPHLLLSLPRGVPDPPQFSQGPKALLSVTLTRPAHSAVQSSS